MDDISAIFSSGHYRDLPPLIHSIFQEAANCFACEQYKAAAVLAWQGAKATLAEYYDRRCIAKEEEARLQSDVLTWKEIVNALFADIFSDVESSTYLSQGVANLRAKQYNKIIQSSAPIEKEEAWRQIEVAVKFSIDLVEYWQAGHYTHAVEVSYPPDKDVSLALFLLERYGGGLGRFEFLPQEYPSPTTPSGTINLRIDGTPVKISNLGSDHYQITQKVMAEYGVRVERFDSKYRFLWKNLPDANIITMLDRLLRDTRLDEMDRKAISKLRQILGVRIGEFEKTQIKTPSLLDESSLRYSGEQIL